MEKILVLDNYDSFTYNLVQILRNLGLSERIEVHRNDEIALEAVAHYHHILLSPGPGLPSEAGIMSELIAQYAPEKNILGVCLGHQAIAEAFGAYLVNIPEVLHGIDNLIEVLDEEERMFWGLPKHFKIGHYHSWSVKPKSVPDALHVTACDDFGHIMAIRHKEYNVRGVQFHPESVMTEHGEAMMKNWLSMA